MHSGSILAQHSIQWLRPDLADVDSKSPGGLPSASSSGQCQAAMLHLAQCRACDHGGCLSRDAGGLTRRADMDRVSSCQSEPATACIMHAAPNRQQWTHLQEGVCTAPQATLRPDVRQELPFVDERVDLKLTCGPAGVSGRHVCTRSCLCRWGQAAPSSGGHSSTRRSAAAVCEACQKHHTTLPGGGQATMRSAHPRTSQEAAACQ